MPVSMIVTARSITSLIFTVCALVFTIFPVKTKLKIKTYVFTLNYETVPVIITFILCCTTAISGQTIIRGMLGSAAPEKYKDPTSNSNLVPLTVIVLFFGLAYACCSAEHSQLFKLIAQAFEKLALKSRNQLVTGMALFFIFAGIFTLCTSNDIVILCLTPIILEFISQIRGGSVLIPYLVCQFASANTFSAALLTGNPSNIILTQVFDINFIEYLKPMILVGLTAGVVSFIFACILLKINRPLGDKSSAYQSTEMRDNVIESDVSSVGPTNDLDDSVQVLPGHVTEQKVRPQSSNYVGHPQEARTFTQTIKFSSLDKYQRVNIVFSATVMCLIFVLFLFSSLLEQALTWFELYYIAILGAVVQLTKDIVIDAKIKDHSLKQICCKLPWGVPLFLLSMFILVENAISINLISDIATLVAKLLDGKNQFICAYFSGAIMIIGCILFNNLPGTIIIARILNDNSLLENKNIRAGALAAAAASNFGALFMPHCSLAGLMWSQLVHKPEIMKKTWLLLALCGVLVFVCSTLVVSLTWKW